MGIGNFGNMMKIMNAWNTFKQNHPKFPAFCNAVSKRGIREGSILEVTYISPEGEKLTTNIKVLPSDMEKKKREEFIDIAKGIAILCVIIGHTWKNAYPADKRLMVFIYSFHMPLFFILSGWCLKSTDVKISSVIVKWYRT